MGLVISLHIDAKHWQTNIVELSCGHYSITIATILAIAGLIISLITYQIFWEGFGGYKKSHPDAAMARLSTNRVMKGTVGNGVGAGTIGARA